MAQVSDVLKFKDKGVSVEEARKRMLEAGEAPSGILKEARKNAASGAVIPAAPAPTQKSGPEPVVPAAPVTPVVTAAPVAATPVVPTPTPTATPKVERQETAQFILEIRQEGGEWAAEITYKNGAGSEKFTAPTRNALGLKLLEGKANATLRVRKAIRREKYGIELDKVYTLPEGMTNEDFNAMPDVAQRKLLDALAATAGLQFRENSPEYAFTDKNSMKVQTFLAKQGLPITVTNLEYAFAELAEEDEDFDLKAAPQVLTPVPPVTPAVVDSTPAATPAAPAPAVVVETAPVAEVVRKRGTTGLPPGFSNSAPTESATEDGGGSREPSAAELRNLPLDELRKRARQMYKPRNF